MGLSSVEEKKGSVRASTSVHQPPRLALALLNGGHGAGGVAASAAAASSSSTSSVSTSLPLPSSNTEPFPFSPRALPTPRLRLQKALALDRKIDEELLQQGWTQITRTAKKIDGVYTLVTAFHRGEDLRISVYVVNSSRVHEIMIKSRRLPTLQSQRVKEYVVYIVGKYCFDEDGNLVRKKKARRRRSSGVESSVGSEPGRGRLSKK